MWSAELLLARSEGSKIQRNERNSTEQHNRTAARTAQTRKQTDRQTTRHRTNRTAKERPLLKQLRKYQLSQATTKSLWSQILCKRCGCVDCRERRLRQGIPTRDRGMSEQSTIEGFPFSASASEACPFSDPGSDHDADSSTEKMNVLSNKIVDPFPLHEQDRRSASAPRTSSVPQVESGRLHHLSYAGDFRIQLFS